MDRSHYQTTTWIGTDTAGGSAGGAVGGYDGGAVGGYDGGAVGGSDGGAVGGYDGGAVGGYDGGAVGGSDGGAAGGSVGGDAGRFDGDDVNGNYEDYDYQFTLTNGFGNRYQTYNDVEDYIRHSQEAMMQAVINGLPTPRFSGPVSSSFFHFSEPGTYNVDSNQQAYGFENEYQQFSLPLSTHWSPVTRYDTSQQATPYVGNNGIANEHVSTVTEDLVETTEGEDPSAIDMSIAEDGNMEEERDVPEQINYDDDAYDAVEGRGVAGIEQEALNASVITTGGNLNTGFGEDDEMETCCENLKLVEL